MIFKVPFNPYYSIIQWFEENISIWGDNALYLAWIHTEYM